MKRVFILCFCMTAALAAEDTELSVLQEIRGHAAAIVTALDAAETAAATHRVRSEFLAQAIALGIGFLLGGLSLGVIQRAMRQRDFE